MYYSAIGSLAIMILVIENHDILLKRSDSLKLPTWKVYRGFLLAVLVYYVTDILWGVLESQKLSTLLFIDTTLYFVAMAVGIFFWTQYTVDYLNGNSAYGRALLYTGRIFCAAVMLITVVNVFTPILFRIDEQCVYHAQTLRYAILVAQIVLLVVLSVYAFSTMARKKGAIGRRYRAIAFFGLVMAAFLFLQLLFPYLPIYSIAYMLGTSLLRTFVVNEEKEEYKYELEKALEREKRQYEELRSAQVLAYTDALTGVNCNLAYVEMEKQKDLDIRKRRINEFAVAVFDLNGLKEINDKRGHEQGDRFIIDACRAICSHFKRSPVFRIGGDEFVALIEGEDYQNRQDIKDRFIRLMENADEEEHAIVAMGMADYTPEQDNSFNDVFERADNHMYIRKRELKSRKGVAH